MHGTRIRYGARTGTWAARVLRLGIALAVAGCASDQGSVSGGAKLGPAEFTIEGQWGSKALQVTNPPNVARVDVEFRDAQGNVLPGSGATGVPTGGIVSIPDGAAVVVISGASQATTCTGCLNGGESAGPDPASGSGRAPASLQGKVKRFLYGAPLKALLDPDAPEYGPLANTAWYVDVYAAASKTPSQLFAMAAPFLLSAPLNEPPVSGNVQVGAVARVVPNTGSQGARLFVSSVSADPFEQFDFFLNGILYADLATNSTQHAPQNGWQAVEVAIPLSDFNLPGGLFDNEFETVTKTVEASSPVDLDVRLIYN